MKGQKIITKCLFLAALFFLSLIFFFANGENGTDDAGQKATHPSPALTPRADRADSAARVPPPSVEPLATPLPRPELDVGSLALLAVFEAHSPLAAAVIQVEGHGAHRYHVGSPLSEGGVLEAIRPTEVVIENAGRLITLRLALRGGAGRAEVADADPEEEPADDGPKMPQKVLDFLNKLDLTPVSKDSPEGYRVGDDFPESGTEEIGVKPGDTIVAVNGYPVGEYHSDYLVWLSFKDRYRASVLVRTEDGKEFSFHFPDDLKGVSLPGQGG